MGALQVLDDGSIPYGSTTPFSILSTVLLYPMLHKLKQQINRYRFTDSNRLPLRRARQFLMNRFRSVRLDMPSAPLRAAMGLVR